MPFEMEQSMARARPTLHRTNSGRLSKYGASKEPPRDDALFYPTDDSHSFFAKVMG